MPACKHGAWDYCGECLSEYAAESRGALTPEQLRRDQAEGAAREIRRLACERDEARALLAKWSEWHDDALSLLRKSLAQVNEAITIAREATTECDRLRTLLREVEWGANGEDFPVCPSCGGIEVHLDYCRLKVALEK